MTVVGLFSEQWRASRHLKELKAAGDTRTFFIEHREGDEFPYVLHAGPPRGSDLDPEPQRVYDFDGDAA